MRLTRFYHGRLAESLAGRLFFPHTLSPPQFEQHPYIQAILNQYGILADMDEADNSTTARLSEK